MALYHEYPVNIDGLDKPAIFDASTISLRFYDRAIHKSYPSRFVLHWSDVNNIEIVEKILHSLLSVDTIAKFKKLDTPLPHKLMNDIIP